MRAKAAALHAAGQKLDVVRVVVTVFERRLRRGNSVLGETSEGAAEAPPKI